MAAAGERAVSRSWRLRSPIDRWLGLAAATNGVSVERDLSMTTADGVRVLATRYRPIGVERGPVVLIRSPYGRGGGLAARTLERPIAARGFQVVQSVRGTFGSGGVFEPGRHGRADGVAAVAWVRAQPWCDGRVAMAGGSYLGSTQWAVAPFLEQPLDAMAVSIGSSSMLAGWYPQGALGVGQALRWAGLLAEQERAGGPLRIARAGRRVAAALRPRSYRDADLRAIGRTSALFQENIDHVEDGEHWAGAIDFRASRHRVHGPVSMVTGWQDLFLRQQLEDFTALQDAGHRPRLTVGPWWHGSAGLLPTAVQETLRTLHHVWDGATDDRPPVRIHVSGIDEWRDLDRWPPASTVRSFAFSPDPHPGRQHAASDLRIVHDPDDPTPSQGGPTLQPPAGRRRQGDIEARDDVLVHTSAAVEEALEVIGQPVAHLRLSTPSPSAMVVVRLCDVDPRGRSINVTEGLLRLTGPHHGQPVAVDLDPTAHVFLPGHRVRLQVTVGAHPRVVLPTPSAARIGYEVTVHHHPGRHPTIDLPVPA